MERSLACSGRCRSSARAEGFSFLVMRRLSAFWMDSRIDLGSSNYARLETCQHQLAKFPSSRKERGMDAVPDYSIQERNPARAALSCNDSCLP